MAIQVGQRWRWNDHGYNDVIVEVESIPYNDSVRARFVQIYKSPYNVGYLGTFESIPTSGDSDANWTLLEGQERPK